jgi:prolyl-tRNA editing enzyme YbaK/EbsC (Cys-tRNA(Pro) deacylase)
MEAKLPGRSQRVQDALARLGLPFQVVVMPDTTRTAQEAASAIGCGVAQIAKSILFKSAQSGKPVLVVASGVNRVNEKLVTALRGEALEKASAEFVRTSTGYVIGGVPPLGFPEPIETWIDEDLLRFEEVWAAAGTPFAVFRFKPQSLAQMTAGTVARIAAANPAS